MGDHFCEFCGEKVPEGSRYCPHCGGSQHNPVDPSRLGSRYWGFRFQVDPISPAPRRDRRWVMIVLGSALTILGVLFLSVGSIVAFAVGTASSGCVSTSCSGVDPALWFTWGGAGCAAVGILVVIVGLWRALR